MFVTMLTHFYTQIYREICMHTYSTHIHTQTYICAFNLLQIINFVLLLK